jgi:hypothetical protein
MKPAAAAWLLAFAAGLATASAQTPPVPLAPPIGAPPAASPASPISPILINPGLARSPVSAPAAPVPGPTPLDQQQMQSYRGDLVSRQRALEQQGVSPGAEAYRNVQQQLNQLNGAGR